MVLPRSIPPSSPSFGTVKASKKGRSSDRNSRNSIRWIFWTFAARKRLNTSWSLVSCFCNFCFSLSIWAYWVWSSLAPACWLQPVIVRAISQWSPCFPSHPSFNFGARTSSPRGLYRGFDRGGGRAGCVGSGMFAAVCSRRYIRQRYIRRLDLSAYFAI
jgi:hypothetical protein